MVLNLGRYQAPQPYPIVNNVYPDEKLAATLADAYSGITSELTTSLQYAYHSLQIQDKYSEISDIIRGIFHVETLHMELLGDCIRKLGGDIHYIVTLQDRPLSWQASFVNYESTPENMLLADIKGEEYAAAFYEETSAIATQADIANLLARLAKDERLHESMFKKLHQMYF